MSVYIGENVKTPNLRLFAYSSEKVKFFAQGAVPKEITTTFCNDVKCDVPYDLESIKKLVVHQCAVNDFTVEYLKDSDYSSMVVPPAVSIKRENEKWIIEGDRTMIED